MYEEYDLEPDNKAKLVKQDFYAANQQAKYHPDDDEDENETFGKAR